MDEERAQAAVVLNVALKYASQGSNLAHAAMAGATQCVELAHYPRHDVVDRRHASRFFYHVHSSHRRPRIEHGHFHVFCHGKSPADYFHLVGISLNTQGLPVRLFTTNRWVTGERWRSATEVEAALATFEIQALGRMAPVARWITAMTHLYAPQIRQLVQRRDAVMQRRSLNAEWEKICEDRRLDVVTQRRISLEHCIQQLACS